MIIGVDVGGTNTDAVLMEGREVRASRKTPTTQDVTTGIADALNSVLADANVPPEEIKAVMIGTTHFTNAVVERKRLTEVAAIRLALPATKCLPPMVDWPIDLRDSIGNHQYLCHGGYEFDGRLIAPLDEKEILEVTKDIRDKGISSVAISAVFSPINSELEQQAAEIVRNEIPDVSISLSQEIGRISLLERENATVLNACLRELARQVINSLRESLKNVNITAPLYISQNDGTLMNSKFAEKYPVLTFSSGPTNSMRGAAFLSGLKEAMVVDVGGTTSDVGMLIQGFPREASIAVQIGGVRTNFRMPDVYSFGLGGGSIIQEDPVRIGPDSVGYELTQEGLVFGGGTITATDIAVANGSVFIGDRSLVDGLDDELVQEASEGMHQMVETAVDRMKTSPEAVPVIIVGGGSILIHRHIKGTSDVIKPENYEVANAIGAAIAQVGGEIDRVFSLEEMSREQALQQAKEEARENAIAAGADSNTLDVVDVEEVPLTYLPSNAVRIKVKTVGDLALSNSN